MKLLPVLACASAVTLLAACNPYPDGYYDEYGNYIPPSGTLTEAKKSNAAYNDAMRAHRQNTDGRPYYTRAGYYDYYGYYLPYDSGLNAPRDMYPGRGMCRVWFPDRAPMYQPRIESCDGIQYRVPPGAYVIYGG